MIPICRPSLGEEELEEVRKVFATGWLRIGALFQKRMISGKRKFL